MHILLVDDQISVLNGMLSGVNWKQIGVSEVKIACNGITAREIMEKYSIDLMFCDIEMPGENGITLLHWVRQHKMDIECIFLTAHADFLYAKEAIQLGAFGYILQPARYDEIKNAVKQVAEHIYEKREEKSFYEYGRSVYQKRMTPLHALLDKWEAEEYPSAISIFPDLNKLGIPLKPNSRIFFVLTQIVLWHVDPLGVGNWSISLESTLSELFEKVGCHVLTFRSDLSSLPFIIYAQSLIPLEMMVERLQQAETICRDKLKFEMAFYTSRSFCAKRLSEYIRKAQNMKCNNAAHKRGIFYTDYPDTEKFNDYDSFNFEKWVKLLRNGKAKTAERCAIRYLRKLQNKGLLDQDVLSYFYQNFQKVIGKVTGRNNQALNEILRQNEIRILSEKACDNIENMIRLIKALTPFYLLNKNSTESKEKIILQIQSYIQNHLEKNFTCQDIANSIYLNSDYISRIFRQELGITLKDYMTDERMKTAQNLIQSTRLPIGIIAAKVGFSNFSHFSQVYKKTFGASPSDARK